MPGRVTGKPSARRRLQLGFTLYELLVSLVIGGGASASAAGLYGFAQEHRSVAAVNELVGHLNLARSEAIKRGVEVIVCASADGGECADADDNYTWWDGYLAYVDENDNGHLDTTDTPLRFAVAKNGDLTVRTSTHRTKVTFQPSGLSPGSTVTFAFCDRRDARGARYVTVQNGGRARVSRTTTSSVQCA